MEIIWQNVSFLKDSHYHLYPLFSATDKAMGQSKNS